jgi:hypothetical protein
MSLGVFDLQSAMLSELKILDFVTTIGVQVINGLAVKFLGARFFGGAWVGC